MEFLLLPVFPAANWLPWSAGSHKTHKEQSVFHCDVPRRDPRADLLHSGWIATPLDQLQSWFMCYPFDLYTTENAQCDALR